MAVLLKIPTTCNSVAEVIGTLEKLTNIEAIVVIIDEGTSQLMLSAFKDSAMTFKDANFMLDAAKAEMWADFFKD
jgi:hypothetical protein